LTELEKSERIARYAHETQKDLRGEPHIRHVERVVAQVTARGASEALKAVAWLHDVIEDSTWTHHQLVARVGISEPVADAVDLLSRKEGETYSEYIDRVARSGNPLALPVKLADLQDHLWSNYPMRLRERCERALPLIEAAQPREPLAEAI